jgi:aspartate--ammonia ligase
MALSVIRTQKAIKYIKDTFEETLADHLNLIRVSAPKFIRMGTGVQDDLANTCKSVSFNIPSCGFDVEIVHSLAKWKRIALEKYGLVRYAGLYTDMDAIRKDEVLDHLHSAYVDQWDWEMAIEQDDRNIKFLQSVVEKIYSALLRTEKDIYETFGITRILPDKITFIDTEELVKLFPDLTPKERENEITKKHGAVFLIGIGGKLSDGKNHDIRAFDYDDWSTFNGEYFGLNGDILLWNPVLNSAFELSSMGIRVDAQSLVRQSEISGQPINTPYHQMVLNNMIPLSIGGGIGQSRLCMFLLQKRHIGEVQCSEWPDDMVDACKRKGIFLL